MPHSRNKYEDAQENEVKPHIDAHDHACTDETTNGKQPKIDAQATKCTF